LYLVCGASSNGGAVANDINGQPTSVASGVAWRMANGVLSFV